MDQSVPIEAVPREGGWELTFPRYTASQLFALVSDIERYPAFVPGCVAARITEKSGEHWSVDNVYNFGPLRSRFTSFADLEPPYRLDIRSEDGPWKQLHLAWRFEAKGDGCGLTCRFSAIFRSRVLATLASLRMTETERRVMAAFEKRARLLYG
jgi:coenzyme Q-binding protein COQ10